ncbi:hypothetical protein PoB_005295800 [Plakobranchus ocellatus]|uniref:Uncharacterized protein n=1 Tax=Plakobranchus ocellatus TaxID=259542 RepID=A0AAV4C3G9_9GAST|nr:hypothetical protein PoB_005295800 [Plakobranchus ocellatus]
MSQKTTETTLEEAKIYIKAAARTRWTKQHMYSSVHMTNTTLRTERSKQSSFGSEQGISGSKNTCVHQAQNWRDTHLPVWTRVPIS